MSERRYLIWSFHHRQWWMADRNGYAGVVHRAGRYSAKDAIEILCDDVTRRNIPVREDEANDNAWPARENVPA